MGSSQARNVALCALAGAAVPLAFAPFYWWWLAPICYAALFLAWREATPRQAFARGWMFGCAQFLFGVYWIYISVHEIGQAPIWIAVDRPSLLICLRCLLYRWGKLFSSALAIVVATMLARR